ncbi:MAG: TatD family hydrolase [Pseudomonadota bacterium]
MLVDSHCHLDRLDLSPYENDFSRFMEEAEAHLEHMLCIAIALEAYPDMRRPVKGYKNVSVTVGVHPNEQGVKEPSVDQLAALAQEPEVLGIGETGLDYFRSEGDLGWQHERFRTHIRAAKRIGKPLVVHTREAKEDTLRILREEGADAAGGVLHCFTEDWDMALRALDLGFYVSFSGIVTFNNAKSVQEVARKMPADRILIETDSPYLAPVPFRGKPNYPLYVRYVAERIADLRGLGLSKVVDLTTRNFYDLFKGAAN